MAPSDLFRGRSPFDVPADTEPAALHPDWSIEDYLADPGVSRTPLWTCYHRSPYESRFIKPSTDAMALGTALHYALLEPEECERRVVVFTGAQRRGKEWEAFKAEHEGKTILARRDGGTFARVRDYARRIRGVRRMLEQGASEQSITWTDGGTGLRCKARPDFLALDKASAQAVVIDVKTTSVDLYNVSALKHHADEFGYIMQQAMIRIALRELGYTVRDSWILWLRTTGAPLHRIAPLLSESLDRGEREFREAIDLYARCLAADDWPLPDFGFQPLPETTEL